MLNYFSWTLKIRRMESTSSDSKVKLETELEVFKKSGYQFDRSKGHAGS